MTTSDPGNLSGNPQQAAPAAGAGNQAHWGGPLARLAVLAGVLIICFHKPLCQLAGFAMDSQFFSYIPLIPLITGYLIWIRRGKLGAAIRPAWGAAAAAAAGGLAMLAAYGWAVHRGWAPLMEDSLAITTTSFLLLLLAAGFASVGTRTMTDVAFPLAILIFMVPYPERLLNAIEAFFQHTSAVAASGMFHMIGTTVSRHGLFLTLPDSLPTAAHPDKGLILEVAPECSGIHSSQVLLITSLLAGNLFLRSPWRRVVLALFVIPLAILRNGFRIFTLGELCVHVSGKAIDSPIHHKGGPIFFALSLVPFFLFLMWLRKNECKT
jgi:exosortase C (VPDSG-CTERM-specific)